MYFPSYIRKIASIVAIIAPMKAAITINTAEAAEVTSVVVGVVDVPRLVRESVAGKIVWEQRQKYLAGLQNETRKEEKELSDTDQELTRQRTILSPEVLAEKQREFQKRLQEFQRTVEQRRRNLDRAFGTAVSQIDKKIVELVQAVAKERSVNVVLSQTQVYMFEPRFDMTDAVMERLNKALSKVVMPDPSKMPISNEDDEVIKK